MFKPVNKTLLTLIPKVSDDIHMKNFRPISCFNTLYKVISKIMATRMSRVMSNIVSKN